MEARRYVYITSMDSILEYPENDPFHFRARLWSPLTFPSTQRWEVGLIQLSFQNKSNLRAPTPREAEEEESWTEAGLPALAGRGGVRFRAADPEAQEPASEILERDSDAQKASSRVTGSGSDPQKTQSHPADGVSDSSQTASQTTDGAADSIKTAPPSADGAADSIQTGRQTTDGAADSTASETTDRVADPAETGSQSAVSEDAGARAPQGDVSRPPQREDALALVSIDPATGGGQLHLVSESGVATRTLHTASMVCYVPTSGQKEWVALPHDRRYRSVAQLFYSILEQIKDKHWAKLMMNSIYSKMIEDARNDMDSFTHDEASVIVSETFKHTVNVDGTTVQFRCKNYDSFPELYEEIKAHVPSYDVMYRLIYNWTRYASAYYGNAPSVTIFYDEDKRESCVKLPIFEDEEMEMLEWINFALDALPDEDTILTVIYRVKLLLSNCDGIRMQYSDKIKLLNNDEKFTRLKCKDRNNLIWRARLPAGEYQHLGELVATFWQHTRRANGWRCEEAFKNVFLNGLFPEYEERVSQHIRRGRKRVRREENGVGDTITLGSTWVFANIVQEQMIARTMLPVLTTIEDFVFSQKYKTFTPEKNLNLNTNFVDVRPSGFYDHIEITILRRAVREDGCSHWGVPYITSGNSILVTQVGLLFRRVA